MACPPRNLVPAAALALFLCMHWIATLLLIQVAANTPSGGVRAAVIKGLAAVLALPLLLPLMWSDPDGDRLPRWFQVASVALNSSVWCLAILLVVVIRRRSRRGCPGFDVVGLSRADEADRA